MANGSDEFASSSWLQRARVRASLRWSLLALAAICAAITAVACARPIISEHIGPFKITIQRPIKGVIAAAIALHLWALLGPPRFAAAWRFRILLWRAMLWAVAVESGVLAAVGVVSTDLRWKWAADLRWINPVHASALSFLLTALLLTKSNPIQQINAVLGRCRIQWKQWNWGARIVLVAFLLQAGVMGKMATDYWKHTSLMYLRDPGTESKLLASKGRLLPSFNYFCDACRSQIPADARVLYHGPNQGLILAYELYPRRLFMLPCEQRAMFHECWRNEVWCRGMPADPLYEIWKWDPPISEVSEGRFIAEHRITYVVTFDEEHPAGCRIHKAY